MESRVEVELSDQPQTLCISSWTHGSYSGPEPLAVSETHSVNGQSEAVCGTAEWPEPVKHSRGQFYSEIDGEPFSEPRKGIHNYQPLDHLRVTQCEAQRYGAPEGFADDYCFLFSDIANNPSQIAGQVVISEFFVLAGAKGYYAIMGS